MSHSEQLSFVQGVRQRLPQHFNNTRVLEVGSLNINGSVRQFFHKCNYTGIDIVHGPDVDLMRSCAEHLCKPQYENSYDVIISCEMLEHDRTWNTDLQLMYWALKPSGLLLLTAGGDGRPEHGTTMHHAWASPGTNDWYFNISNEMIGEVLQPRMFKEYYLNQCPINQDMQFYGVKTGPEGR
jgi:SAM-dependent methyltransferase